MSKKKKTQTELKLKIKCTLFPTRKFYRHSIKIHIYILCVYYIHIHVYSCTFSSSQLLLYTFSFIFLDVDVCIYIYIYIELFSHAILQQYKQSMFNDNVDLRNVQASRTSIAVWAIRNASFKIGRLIYEDRRVTVINQSPSPLSRSILFYMVSRLIIKINKSDLRLMIYRQCWVRYI